MELEPQLEPLSCLSGHTWTAAISFDGETIRRMGIAFETALASLGATRGYDDPVRAALARSIVALAQAGEHDPEYVRLAPHTCQTTVKCGCEWPLRTRASTLKP